MTSVAGCRSAGRSDRGLIRDLNEDRFHADPTRGLFIVVDGIGGQAAGEKAADLAIEMLLLRLQRETGPVADRIREAVTVANNEIFRAASLHPEWHGMACVLTVAVIENGRTTIGHVGDSRAYKLQGDRIEKVTRDHSPVGEREDANELSELEAMRHPRRNEVYRDVGSEPHEPGDSDFVEIHEMAFEADSALLLCSDGLSDLVPSAEIAAVARRFAGDADAVAQALIDSAKNAGGKDNVTVVYVEGSQFGAAVDRMATGPIRPAGVSGMRAFIIAATILTALLAGFAAGRTMGRVPLTGIPLLEPITTAAQVVRPSESIMEALERAQPGSDVIVEPGEYRERIVLKDRVRLLSRVPRAAVLRLPPAASEADPAVVASDLTTSEISGFRIVGDSATPLGIGVLVRNAAVAIVDVEISGATHAALDLSGEREASMIGSDIRENAGAAVVFRGGSVSRLTHNSFVRNGLAEQGPHAFVVEAGAQSHVRKNTFHGLTTDAFAEFADQGLLRDNLFLDIPASAPQRGRSH